MRYIRINSLPVAALAAGLCAAVLTGCADNESTEPIDEPVPADEAAKDAAAATSATLVSADREVVTGDVAHYTFTLKIGDGPNAYLRLHQVVRESKPWLSLPTVGAALLVHGDFATFTSNFVPSQVSAGAPPERGLAVYLAGKGIDVWGLDRRWTHAPAEMDADVSDFANMGIAQVMGDVGQSLSFARKVRALTGAGEGRMVLGGFSSGAYIAYEYAGAESQISADEQHVGGLVPIDIYDRIDPKDEDLRLRACKRSTDGLAALESGAHDSDNSFFRLIGPLAKSAPMDPSPAVDGYTNRAIVLELATQTHHFFAPTDDYHLIAGVIANDMASDVRFSSEEMVADWFSVAPLHESLRETVDMDASWCGEGTLPLPDHLADIEVPLFYLGAAGGFGDRGVYSTTQVASTDVTTLVVRRLDAAQQAEDFGHGDLLFAPEAAELAWAPLSEWLEKH